MKFHLALITGATSGIGAKLAEMIEAKGLHTIVTGRNEAQLRPFKGKKRVVDLAHDRAELIDLIREEAPDLIINNAGFGLYGKGIDLSIAEQLDMVEVNNKALLEITLEGAKALKSRGKKGTIMNISSAAAFQPFPYFAVYAATKAFVNSFSQSLDHELKHDGIRVLASCPGMVESNFSHRASKGKGQRRVNKMSLELATQEIWHQIETGKPIHIFDWRYRLLTRLGQFLIPNRLIGPFLAQQL